MNIDGELRRHERHGRRVPGFERVTAEPVAVGAHQAEGAGEQPYGRRPRRGGPTSLQIADAPDAHAGLLGQLLLGQAQASALRTDGLTEHVSLPVRPGAAPLGPARSYCARP
jgi:hypothetical protein